MQTMRARLARNTLIVLLIGMGLAGTLAWLTVEQLYVDTQRENLLAQARLIATALQDTSLPAGPIQPYSQAVNVTPGVHTRLLNEGGAVVVGLPLPGGNAFVQVPDVENSASVSTLELVGRPEIRAALKGEPASALRRVASAGNRRVLYAAAPIQNEDGMVTGIVYIATPLPVSGLPSNIVLELLGVLLAAVLLAGVAGGFLARQIAQPLERLARAADAVAGGDLEPSLPTNSDITELKDLGLTFNAMTDSLRQSDQAKKAFIADVTHELRTPLTVIKGTIETLEDGALDDPEGRGPLLASMGRETERLIRLVNDLLVLTRADAGALHLDLQPMNLAELASDRSEQLRSLASRQGIELSLIDQAEQNACVQADPDRVSQVLDNLLDNAIRYAPSDSTITVLIKTNKDQVECSVTDQGSGIPAGHLPFIFERFYRVDASRDRHKGGMGLGLAIARALILAQGGKIAADSVEGQGTTITFWLPSSEDCHPTA